MTNPTDSTDPTNPTDSTALDLLARATEVRADAVHHLTLLAGDASMCAIGRSGRSFPAAKYHEGRQSSAGQVRRALMRDPDAGSSALEALEAIEQDWQQTLADAEPKGRDWVAYATGGLDALGEIREPAPPLPATPPVSRP